MRYLGTINNAGSDVVNNSTTSTPFAIPAGCNALVLQPSAATMMAATSSNNATFLPAANNMLQLGAINSVNNIPLMWNEAVGGYGSANLGPTLAVRKTDAGAGTTLVFGVGL